MGPMVSTHLPGSGCHHVQSKAVGTGDLFYPNLKLLLLVINPKAKTGKNCQAFAYLEAGARPHLSFLTGVPRNPLEQQSGPSCFTNLIPWGGMV